MTVTFNPGSPDFAIHRRSQLRLLAGDTTENDGPRPSQGNYQDNELDMFLSLENGDIDRAAARVFETLAAEWSRLAGVYRLGPESEEMRQAAEFAARAAAIRQQHGYTTASERDGGASSGFVDWSDAYASWIGKF